MEPALLCSAHSVVTGEQKGGFSPKSAHRQSKLILQLQEMFLSCPPASYSHVECEHHLLTDSSGDFPELPFASPAALALTNR